MFVVLSMDYVCALGRGIDLVTYHLVKVSQKKWHPMILEHLPNIQLTLLIGQYAQKNYLLENKDNVADTVKNYRQFLPHFMPLASFPSQSALDHKDRWF